MPISPQTVAERRLENTVNKLCDLIDRKLQESEDSPFEFRFLPNTSPQAENAILEIYQSVGWIASLKIAGDEHALVLQHPSANQSETSSVALDSKPKNNKAKGREELVENALETEIGRIHLAQAMAEPIKTALTYQSPIRKFFLTDELPKKSQPKYTYGEHGNPIYYASDCTVKPYIHQKEEDWDWSEFAALQTINKDDLTDRKYYTVDLAQVRLKDAIERRETMALINLLDASIQSDEQVVHTYGETLKRAILDSMGELESKDMLVAKMLCHPRTYRRMCNVLGIDFIDEATHREILMTGLYGHIQTADVHLSVMAPENEIYMTPTGNFLGTLALPPGHLQVNPCTDENGDLGFLANQKCMPIMLNPNLVHKVKVRW